MAMPPRCAPASDPAALAEAAERLRAGELLVFPTETLYALGCDGLNAAALERLRAARGRPAGQGFILLVADPQMAAALAAEIMPVAHALMERFWPGPLTLIVRAGDAVPAEATAGDHTLALRQSPDPTVAALIRATGRPLAAPSANRAGAPPPRTAEEAISSLGAHFSLALDAGPSPGATPSTLVEATGDVPRLVREGAIAWTTICAALHR